MSIPSTNRIVRVDAHTADYLDAPDVTGRFTYIMLKLHTDMFAGLPGKLFLGLMGHPVLRRHRLRHRGLRTVHAQTEVRHRTGRTVRASCAGSTSTISSASSW